MPRLDLGTCRVVSVYGPFASRALVDMSTKDAEKLLGDRLGDLAPSRVVDAIQRDLDAMPSGLSVSALAATALALGFELEHPYNSATSKSMCAKTLIESLDRLRALAPAEREADDLDDLAARRTARLGGSAAEHAGGP